LPVGSEDAIAIIAVTQYKPLMTKSAITGKAIFGYVKPILGIEHKAKSQIQN
jgi:hypothetical protein